MVARSSASYVSIFRAAGKLIDRNVSAEKAKSERDKSHTPSIKTSMERNSAAADRTLSIRKVMSIDELIE